MLSNLTIMRHTNPNNILYFSENYDFRFTIFDDYGINGGKIDRLMQSHPKQSA